MSQEPIELGAIGAIDHDARSRVGLPEQGVDESPDGNPEFSLPPVDGGKEAWLFLAACFVVDALIWGMKTPSHRYPTRCDLT